MLKQYGFYRGINLGGWFSQCDYSKERLDNFVTESDFAKIAGWGMDHVRIPVDYNILEDNAGGYLDEGFARLQKALELCKKYGMKLVLDLHKTFPSTTTARMSTASLRVRSFRSVFTAFGKKSPAGSAMRPIPWHLNSLMK